MNNRTVSMPVFNSFVFEIPGILILSVMSYHNRVKQIDRLTVLQSDRLAADRSV